MAEPASHGAQASSADAPSRAQLLDDRSGATAIEYTLMAALFGVAVFLGSTAVRDDLLEAWDEVLLPQLIAAFSGGAGDGGE